MTLLENYTVGGSVNFITHFGTKARGTAILIHKGVLFAHKKTIADKEERLVITVGELDFFS